MVGATVLALLGGRLARPSTRSPYTYTASGSSPVQSASPKRVSLGKTPTVTAQCILGNWANGACVRLSLRGKARLLPRAASTVRSAILRRRDTASSSRLRPVAHHANAASCDRLRGSAFGLGQPDRFATGACRRAVPLRSLLTHAPLARPSAMARFFSQPLHSPTHDRLA